MQLRSYCRDSNTRVLLQLLLIQLNVLRASFI